MLVRTQLEEGKILNTSHLEPKEDGDQNIPPLPKVLLNILPLPQANEENKLMPPFVEE